MGWPFYDTPDVILFRLCNAKMKEIGSGRATPVMAGPVPAIHVLPFGTKNVDARDRPGHDVLQQFP